MNSIAKALPYRQPFFHFLHQSGFWTQCTGALIVCRLCREFFFPTASINGTPGISRVLRIEFFHCIYWNLHYSIQHCFPTRSLLTLLYLLTGVNCREYFTNRSNYLETMIDCLICRISMVISDASESNLIYAIKPKCALFDPCADG